MNAFLNAQQVEADAMKDILPFLADQSDDGRFVLTNKGRLSRELQKRYGDAASQHNGDIVFVEMKAEEDCKYGNLFLETWSNRRRFTLGWMYTLNADVLLYYFLDERCMYSINFTSLRKWAFHEGRIYHYPEKVQNSATCRAGFVEPVCSPDPKEIGIQKQSRWRGGPA